MSKEGWLSRLLGRRSAAEWNDNGVALRRAGRHKEALACFERGLEIDPRDGDLWFDRSFLLRILNLIHTD
jgi:tetratricopeptide (TPR) repeat protein